EVLGWIVTEKHENQNDHCKSQEGAEGVQKSTPRVSHMTGLPPVGASQSGSLPLPIAICKTLSGVHSFVGLASDSTPRVITASRSQRPKSSGKYELTSRIPLRWSASSQMTR